MPNAIWRIERAVNRGFPFRVSIEQDGRTILAVRSKAPWPGPDQNIFCLRERDFDLAEPLELVEKVPVASLTRVGRKLVVVLDRPQRKRCEFLAVDKPRKDGTGTYEQIFFRTESGIRAHRSRTRVELRAEPEPLVVVIDSAERYPWRFPDASVIRRKLPVGDYGLMLRDRLAAVIERKSFDNLLGDFGAVQALHHQLADLASFGVAAFVIEAEYRDFFNPTRLRGRWPAAHVGRVLGELSALHPHLPIVYAGDRKSANAWTHQFFRSLAMRETSPSPQLVLETVAKYEASPRSSGVDDQIRKAALEFALPSFPTAAIAERFPDVPLDRIHRILGYLKDENLLRREGRGRGVRWGKLAPTTG
jgi:hypothetical protein